MHVRTRRDPVGNCSRWGSSQARQPSFFERIKNCRLASASASATASAIWFRIWPVVACEGLRSGLLGHGRVWSRRGWLCNAGSVATCWKWKQRECPLKAGVHLRGPYLCRWIAPWAKGDIDWNFFSAIEEDSVWLWSVTLTKLHLNLVLQKKAKERIKIDKN